MHSTRASKNQRIRLTSTTKRKLNQNSWIQQSIQENNSN